MVVSKLELLDYFGLVTEGKSIERMPSYKYKYLGVRIDDRFFNAHVAGLPGKLKVKLGFCFRIKSLLLMPRKEFVEATFLPVIDYSDILYMQATSSVLRSLDWVDHATQHFITDAKSSPLHSLIDLVGRTSLTTHTAPLVYLYL